MTLDQDQILNSYTNRHGGEVRTNVHALDANAAANDTANVRR